MSCCIQNHPFTFVQNCGADPFEAARILEALGQLEAATRAREAAGGRDGTPPWKKKCIEKYVRCPRSTGTELEIDLMSGKLDWAPIRALARRVLEGGEPLELTDDVRALLRRSAREVAIPAQEAINALRRPRTAMALLRKIRRRIQEGSWRLTVAGNRVSRLEDVGDLEGAREQIEKVLAVEVVPLYRKQAKNVLASIARLQKVAKTGRVDPKLPDSSQLAILVHRLDQGKPLKLTEGMRSFLRRAAVDVAISEAETEESLASPKSAGALLREIVGRRRRGRRRLERALWRMMNLRDAGDLEGARQQLRSDVQPSRRTGP